jgi:hypothetical protein
LRVVPNRVDGHYQLPPVPIVLEVDDNMIDTGLRCEDFQRRDVVQAWWRGAWYSAVVHYVGVRTLTLTFQGEPHTHEDSDRVCTVMHRVSSYNPARVRRAV